MKKASLLLLVLAVFLAPLRGWASSPEVPEFGAKSKTTISIHLQGEGTQRIGIYHLPAGASLWDLIQKAPPSRISNKRFVIARIEDGYERTFGFLLDTKRTPPIPEFSLLDGDFVYASTTLP